MKRHQVEPLVDQETSEASCEVCGGHVDVTWVHASDLIEWEDEQVGKVYAYRITLLVGDEVTDDELDELAGVLEVQAQLAHQAMQEVTDAGVRLLYDDPAHPHDFDLDSDCRCNGPVGWHCLGEESEHWAKQERADSECGHCGWTPG